jgi:hypothetical protein
MAGDAEACSTAFFENGVTRYVPFTITTEIR